MSNTTRQGSADPSQAMPIEASRRGAHRARPNPWFGILPALAVAAVVVAVAVLTYTLFGRGAASSSDSAASPTAAASSAAVAQATSSAPAPGGVQPSRSTAPSAAAVSPSGSVQPSAGAGGVDPTVTLRFFNGTRPNVQGVSRLATDKFTALGWKVGPYAAWTGPAVTETTVYYGKAAQAATAQTIVSTLGVGTTKLSAARAGKGIVIVVSNDYKP